MRRLTLLFSAVLAVAVPMASIGAWAVTDPQTWPRVTHPKYGYSFSYPADVFTLRPNEAQQDGAVLITADGKAQFVIAAFENDEQQSLEGYRQFLISGNYAGATIEYAPKKSNWFVLSGTRGTLHFYERTTFTCGGKLINSWALYYPLAERAIYDPIVEAMAKRYKPGAAVCQ